MTPSLPSSTSIRTGLLIGTLGITATTTHAAILDFNGTNFPVNGNTLAANFINVDGSGVDVTYSAAEGVGSEFFNDSPEFLSPSFSTNFAGALQFQIQTTSGSFTTTPATATLTFTFDAPVQNLSFDLYDIEAFTTGTGLRAESVQVTTDNALANLTLVGGSATSVVGDTVTGTATSPGTNASNPISAEGLVSVSIDGPISVLTLNLANTPTAGATTNGGSLFGLSDITFDAAVIPEPASLALLSLGGLLIAGRRRQN